jgi:plastocyanin
MTRTRFIFALVLVVTGLALAGCGGSDDDESAGTTATTTADTGTDTGTSGGGTLTGTVGPGFDISMTGTDGLTPGEYTITVSDKSESHNFHLTGPGVDMKTEVADIEDTTWTVQLQAGEYKFQCDPHASQMNGSFTVSG